MPCIVQLVHNDIPGLCLSITPADNLVCRMYGSTLQWSEQPVKSLILGLSGLYQFPIPPD